MAPVRAAWIAGLLCLLSGPVLASDCPDDFVAFADTAEPLVCTCSAEAAASGPVWGMNPYTGDSRICRAALHAGSIGRTGGQVTVTPEPGRPAYPGSTRNGVSSSNYGAYKSSFRLPAPATPAVAPTAMPAPAAAPAAVTDCPDNFVAFADTAEPLVCTCSAEATASGPVWGMNPYTGDSRICRAALHAGSIGRTGGQVTVTPEPGRPAYPGSTRNGVSSSNYGAYKSSFRLPAPATPAVTPAPAPPAAGPVQAPVAATLRSTGEVQLYIRFRFGSAELDPSTNPVLEELLGVLRTDPGLKLALIGHTDSVGTRDHNKGLSFRRADAVRTWLVRREVAPTRLAVDGMGFDEPLADNATEIGRAYNRRVQAKRMP